MIDKETFINQILKLRATPIRRISPGVRFPCRELSDPDQLCPKPLVSVVMTVYNHAKYLPQAILGVVTQKCDFEFELLIGEDCSTDESRKICFEFQKQYPQIIRVFYSDINVGGKINSRRMKQRMRGNYVASCEGDDFWVDPCKLQKQVTLFRDNPRYAIVYTDFVTLDPQQKFSQPVLKSSGFFDHIDTFTKRNYITEDFPNTQFSFFATASIMITRRVSEAARLDDLMLQGLMLGDYQLRSLAASMGEVGFVRDCCACYRQGVGILSKVYTQGDITLSCDCFYAGTVRSWDLRNIEEQKHYMGRFIKNVTGYYNAPFRAKVRILKFYLFMFKHGVFNRLGSAGVKLLFNFHVFPQWVLKMRRSFVGRYK